MCSPFGGSLRSLWTWGLVLLACIVSLSAWGLPPGAVDPDFAPQLTIDGSVTQAFPLADGGFIIWGDFTIVNGEARPGLARFHGDGSLDPNFRPALPAGTQLTAVAVQADGRVIVGGYSVGMLRLNGDGTVDASAFGGQVFAAPTTGHRGRRPLSRHGSGICLCNCAGPTCEFAGPAPDFRISPGNISRIERAD
jgi:hypothetical protein